MAFLEKVFRHGSQNPEDEELLKKRVHSPNKGRGWWFVDYLFYLFYIF